MKVDKKSAQHKFINDHLLFWKCISHPVNDVSESYESTFKYIQDVVISFISNFSDNDLTMLDNYLCDLLGEASGRNNRLFMSVLDFHNIIHNEINITEKTCNEIHNELVCKISNDYLITNKECKTIICPLKYINLTREFSALNDDDLDEPYVSLWLLRKQRRIYFHYIMMYVFDICLRMQKIKSMLIKMDIARYGSEEGSSIDFVINEYTLCYMEYNKELIKYMKKLKDCKHYSDHHSMYPNNIHLMCRYDGFIFNEKENTFQSIINEKICKRRFIRRSM